jgi:hypothetical protein
MGSRPCCDNDAPSRGAQINPKTTAAKSINSDRYPAREFDFIPFAVWVLNVKHGDGQQTTDACAAPPGPACLLFPMPAAHLAETSAGPPITAVVSLVVLCTPQCLRYSSSSRPRFSAAASGGGVPSSPQNNALTAWSRFVASKRNPIRIDRIDPNAAH